MTRVDDLASLAAASLTAAGLQVSGPDPGDADGCRLVIACPGAECALMISDAADAELWWTPLAAEAADPHATADLAAALLSGEPGARHPEATDADVPFKGAVGMDLRAGGFAVTLNTYPDDYHYDVTSDIAVTNPRAWNGGTVYVTDEAGFTWHRDYWDEHAETSWEPQFRSWLPDPSAVARAIADTVSRALSLSDALPAAH